MIYKEHLNSSPNQGEVRRGLPLILRGHILDPVRRTLTDGEIHIDDGRIAAIKPLADVPADAPYWLPGFIDSHVHVESSMMLPAEFARVAVRHGSVGAVCDPHEIANVLGIPGIEIMLRSAATVPFHFLFGAPSCVPSCGSDIETSGATLSSADIAELMKRPDIGFLGEMMNFPGVLFSDPEVMAKIQATLDAGKPVDGHAPGLLGDDRRRYAAAGITTDHECTTLDEGRAAIAAGQYVLIREGSAAKDYAALAALITEAPDRVMFCTDDSHPTDFLRGHIDRIVRRAIADGHDIMDILQAACVNPVRHYNMPVGLMQVGDPADLIAISDLTPDFRVLDTLIQGTTPSAPMGHLPQPLSGSATSPQPLSGSATSPLLGKGSADAGERSADAGKESTAGSGEAVRMEAAPITPEDIATPDFPQQESSSAGLPIKGEVARSAGGGNHIIVASDGSLLTGREDGSLDAGVQKLVVYNRYTPGARPTVGWIRGFQLQEGAIAQTVAHDCHNIVAIGTSDALIAEVINSVIAMQGGVAVTDGTTLSTLPLPVGGIISPLSAEVIAERSTALEATVRRAGCPLRSPFITLGFMALPVIPQLKLTDKGLFDATTFSFVK